VQRSGRADSAHKADGAPGKQRGGKPTTASKPQRVSEDTYRWLRSGQAYVWVPEIRCPDPLCQCREAEQST